MTKKETSKGDRPGVDRPIQLSDIESGLRSLKSDIATVKDTAAGTGIVVGLALALGLIALAFVLGRARGKKKFAFVEIRRA